LAVLALAAAATADPAESPGASSPPAPLPQSAPPSPVSSSSASPFSSLAGSGLFTLPDTSTLAPGRFTFGLALDNRDRDPLGLDLFDYGVAFAVGLTSRIEAWGRGVPSRVASLPEPPALPPPHLDLVVLSGPVPPRPHYAIQAAVPYVNKRGSARFGAFVPGDLVLGLKLRLREAAGARPAVALGAEAKVPLSRKTADLQSGAGTGAVDATARLTALWRAGRYELLGSAAYTWTGGPPLGDRVIVAGPDAIAVGDLPLVLADRVDLGFGVRRALGRRLAAAVEVTTALDVGARTRTLDAAAPIDVVAGVQARLGGARLGLGLRYHGHSLPSGERRPSPIAGLVDATGVDDAVLGEWLAAAGAGAAAPHLRAGSQRLLAGAPAGVALPEGGRVLPSEYTVRSEHQLGFVVVWAWAF
jgi:hypothetical protein